MTEVLCLMYNLINKFGNSRFSSRSEPDTRLLDGPSTSARMVAPVAGALSVAGAATTTITTEPNSLEIHTIHEPSSRATTPLPALPTTTETSTIPPETTIITEEVITPVPLNTSTPNSTEATTPTMPAKTINTTTAEIMDLLYSQENRFTILGKDISEEFDIYDLPSAPKDDPKIIQNMLNTSANTTATAATTTPSSPKSDTTDANKDDAVQSQKKLHHRNHNNNHKQGDINSIESISDNNLKPVLNTNFDWIDELYLERNGKAVIQNSKRKKKKKHATTKEMDQLDGVPAKLNTSEPSTDEDEKVVKCLYYTLMCCDCTIS